MTPLSLIGLAIGTVLIRLLHRIRRQLSGTNGYFSFSDLLVEDRIIEHRGFLAAALPPLVGGAVVFFFPGSDALTATAAGFFAAFLGVWPVYLFPFQLLDEELQPFWPKLRYLYALFVGSSTALAYLGYQALAALAPLAKPAVQTSTWQQFVDNFAANALYDVTKYIVVTLLVLGGVRFNRRRRAIGLAAANERDKRREREYADDIERDSPA